MLLPGFTPHPRTGPTLTEVCNHGIEDDICKEEDAQGSCRTTWEEGVGRTVGWDMRGGAGQDRGGGLALVSFARTEDSLQLHGGLV